MIQPCYLCIKPQTSIALLFRRFQLALLVFSNILHFEFATKRGEYLVIGVEDYSFETVDLALQTFECSFVLQGNELCCHIRRIINQPSALRVTAS